MYKIVNGDLKPVLMCNNRVVYEYPSQLSGNPASILLEMMNSGRAVMVFSFGTNYNDMREASAVLSEFARSYSVQSVLNPHGDFPEIIYTLVKIQKQVIAYDAP